jgi:hypothetical protein
MKVRALLIVALVLPVIRRNRGVEHRLAVARTS